MKPGPLLVCLWVAAFAVPACADVVVTAPTNGASVPSPFVLSATASPCSGQAIASMGYSLDTSSSTVIVKSDAINASVTATPGGHTLHVKSWGTQGAACVAEVSVNVTTISSAVPSTAVNVTNLQVMTPWTAVHDSGTPGTSTGAASVVSTPSRSGAALKLSTTFTDYGGERYSLKFADDVTASNFFYDAWVYIENSNAGLTNIEMDLNQVMANGQTVIFGFQCDYWSSTWDYTGNLGTPTAPKDRWIHSAAPCKPRSWALNTWHHVQVAYSRDDTGNATYQYVVLDGVKQVINSTVLSAFALGWAPTLMTNFQIDGGSKTSGSSTVYVDSLTISRW